MKKRIQDQLKPPISSTELKIPTMNTNDVEKFLLAEEDELIELAGRTYFRICSIRSGTTSNIPPPRGGGKVCKLRFEFIWP